MNTDLKARIFGMAAAALGVAACGGAPPPDADAPAQGPLPGSTESKSTPTTNAAEGTCAANGSCGAHSAEHSCGAMKGETESPAASGEAPAAVVPAPSTTTAPEPQKPAAKPTPKPAGKKKMGAEGGCGEGSCGSH
jgi:hypothetical protein